MGRRIVFLDNLKFLAIFLVIYGHATEAFSYDLRDQNVLYKLIYSFHMPLFMIVCGYFFRSSLSLDFKSFFCKKFVMLMIPAISWSVLRFLLIGGVNYYRLCFYEYWFLRSAFVCYFVCYLLIWLIKNEWIAYLLIIAVSLTVNMRSLELSLNTMMPSFVFGILLSEMIDKIITYRTYLLFLSIILFVGSILLNMNYPMPIEKVRAVGDLSILYGLKNIIGLTGALAVFLACTWVNTTKDVIAFIGASTISFYGMNVLFSDLIRFFMRYSDLYNLSIEINYICSIVASFLQLFIFYWVTIYIKKHRVMNYLLMGNR